MHIYLIRHGETQFNAEKRYLGASDVPLSARGRAALCPADFPANVVYISPLCRARETAELLFPGARLIPVEGLQEMNFGIFEGRNYIEMAHDADYRTWVDGGCLGPCPNGESRDIFIERVCAAFEPLLEAALSAGEDRLVIVAHGGTQMALLDRYAAPHRDYYDWRAGFGCGYLLDAVKWPVLKQLKLLSEVSYARPT